MKISCPKFQLNKFVVFALLIPLFLASWLITNNLVKASVTSITPVEDFPQVNGTVYATAVSEDGDTLYIGGEFSEIKDASEAWVSRSNLAAIDLNTMRVTDWNPTNWDNPGPVYDIEIDGDYVLIGGGFYYDSGERWSQFIKLDQEYGLVDETCMPSVTRSGDFPTDTVYDIELTDDYIYLGGDFDQIDDYINVTSVYGLARFYRNTCQLDTNWLPQPGGTVRAIEALGNDVLVGGSFDSFIVDDAYTYTGELVKVSGSDGSLISDCNPIVQAGITFTVYDIEATADHIYLGGSFLSVKGETRNGLARLNNDSTCSLDYDWDPNPHFYYGPEDIYPGTVYTINIDEEDNSLYVGGSFDDIGGQSGSEFAKLDIDTGLADTDWNPEIWSEMEICTVYSSIITDNYLIVGGSFNHVGEIGINALTAFSYQLPPSPTPENTTTPEPTTQPTPTPELSTDSSDDDDDHEEKIQIPHALKKLFGLIVAKPTRDSDTNGQEVLSIVFKDTLDFDAYLSAYHTPAADLQAIRNQGGSNASNSANLNKGNLLIAGWSGGELMGFKEKNTIYWQVGNVQQMYYKAYPAPGKEAPMIIPELQHKSSIIALKYDKNHLIPPGEADTKFNELKLRLAHSLDGINWKIMSNSVVDPINNTVAAVDVVGGYYSIVGTY